MFKNKVLVASTSTGTGNLTIGSAEDGYVSTSVFGSSYFFYGIFNQDVLTEYEIGIGHISGGALVRDYIVQSSNSDAAVNFSAGSKHIYADFPSAIADAAYLHKAPVRTVALTDVTIASALENGDSLNGLTLATGDRVALLKQTTASQNGIYVVPASGAATRALDMYTGFNAKHTIITSEHRRSAYICISGNVIGTDDLVFAPIQLADEVYDLGSGTDLDYDNGRVQTKTLSANTTFTISNLPEGASVRFCIKQGASAYTITWPGGIKWDGDGTEPTVVATANSVMIFVFTKLFGSTYGQLSFSED